MALTFFVIAVPFTVNLPDYLVKVYVAGYLAVYLCFIIGHILLLRYFGYRLVKSSEIPFRFNPGINFPAENPTDSSPTAASLDDA